MAGGSTDLFTVLIGAFAGRRLEMLDQAGRSPAGCVTLGDRADLLEVLLWRSWDT
jgi:hypothetical protein